MAGSTKRSRRLNRRREILRAAERLMNSRGLNGVTTREISQEVGCSEGALYFHFNGRLELLWLCWRKVCRISLGPLQTLRESVGQSSPRAFMEKFSGKPMQPSWSQFAKRLVAAVAPQP